MVRIRGLGCRGWAAQALEYPEDERDGSLHRIALAVFDCSMMYLTLHDFEGAMSQITVRLPDAVVAALDATAVRLKRNRAEIVRQAIGHYLEDFDDLSVAIERLRDPNDPVLDWDRVRRALHNTD